MKHLILYKMIMIFGLLSIFTTSIFVSAVNENRNSILTTQEEFTKVHKLLIYKRDSLGNFISSDIYHMNLKQGKEYYFYSKINIEAGSFLLSVIGPGLSSKIEFGDWLSSTPANERKITFLFTPSESGDHAILIGSLVATDGGSYSLYVNQSGIAGWWWILLIGIIILIILLLVPILLIKSKKKKKKRKRKK